MSEYVMKEVVVPEKFIPQPTPRRIPGGPIKTTRLGELPRLADLIVETCLVGNRRLLGLLFAEGKVKLDGVVITDQFYEYMHMSDAELQIGDETTVKLVERPSM